MENSNNPAEKSTDQTPKVIVINSQLPDRWDEYYVFAHDFDGYAAYPDNLGELANQATKNWYENQALSDDLNLLRACLFCEARRSRFLEGYPSEEDMDYLDALILKIKSNLK